jgi:NAD(P)H-hydrate repair Nnr-like enzyme with NAD(P)H-hydrate dehydratase domain
VFLHGLAADIAAKRFSQEAMLPSDVIEALPEAFTQILA